MIPVLPPSAIAQELTACTVLGGCTGVVRAVFPVRGRAAWVPDFLWVGTVLTLLQSYAAGQSPAGVLRWYMAAAGFAGAGAALCSGRAAARGRDGFAAAGAPACRTAACPAAKCPQITPQRKKNRKKAQKELAKPAPDDV